MIFPFDILGADQVTLIEVEEEAVAMTLLGGEGATNGNKYIKVK